MIESTLRPTTPACPSQVWPDSSIDRPIGKVSSSFHGLVPLCRRRSQRPFGGFLIGLVVGLHCLVYPIAGATAADALNGFAVKVDRGIVFDTPEQTELKCDVYSPIAPAEAYAGRPVVLLIHGGAWSTGSRHMMGGFALRLAREGFVAIAIDYRLAPKWKFPSQLDDVRSSIHWVVSNHDSLGVDPQKIALFGYSAGGHLACLIGTLADEPVAVVNPTSGWPADDPRWVDLTTPLAVCAGGPPCDLRALPAAVGGLGFFLGGSLDQMPEVYASASPLTHASSGDVPTMFIHGMADSIVPVAGSRSLYQQHLQFGVSSEFVSFENQGHLLTFLNPRTADSMVDFFRRKLDHPERR